MSPAQGPRHAAPTLVPATLSTDNQAYTSRMDEYKHFGIASDVYRKVPHC
jgi:hypothetical protein